MSVAVQPRQRVATLPRLLPPAGADASLGAHIERYGHLPGLRREGKALISAVEASGLRGRGGAGFPTHLKLAAVAAGRSPFVVANGIEGEPASHKDSLLMRINPHLVLDGAAAAAACVGARTIVIAVNRSATSAHGSLARAIAERAAGRQPRAIRARHAARPLRRRRGNRPRTVAERRARQAGLRAAEAL